MFIPHRVNVTGILKDKNELELTFRSAYNISEELRKKKGHLLCWNGHYGRVYARKAQYHYGWDWGPSLVTCGPWKPIYLEKYRARIDDVRINYTLDDDLSKATVNVQVSVAGDNAGSRVEIHLRTAEGELMKEPSKDGDFDILRPTLWNPRNGSQEPYKAPMYAVIITIKRAEVILDTKTQPFGIRKIELVQDKDKIGSTFYFKVNNVPIFSGGSNWIPGDSFLPRMTAETYRQWITLAAKANHNMIRIWGGGIYEDDAFYDECDRQGLLVWQDFCFACGQYPADEGFRESVKREAIAAVRRLRDHPSLAILAGNNEDYQVANEGRKCFADELMIC